jgi:hypothetical protein
MAGAAIALLAAGVTQSPRFIGSGLVLLGGAYAVALVLEGGEVHASSAAYTAGLVLIAETAYSRWRPSNARWWREVAALAGAALLLAALILALASLPLAGGIILEGIGAVATLAALGLIAFLARRTAGSRG